jgi:hypothetical protein
MSNIKKIEEKSLSNSNIGSNINIDSDAETVIQSDAEFEEEFGKDLKIKDSKREESLSKTFFQYAQRCTICTEWLYIDGNITTDPTHPWQMVHEECILLSVNHKK